MGENKKKESKERIVLGVIILVLLVAVFAVVYHLFGLTTTSGTKTYTLAVVDDAGNVKDYAAATDAEYLRQALEELEETEDFSMEGEESVYGLYITTVNGVTADYDTDGAYWSVYVNDAYAQNGVDSQPVKDGDAFKLVYESNNE